MLLIIYWYIYRRFCPREARVENLPAVLHQLAKNQSSCDYHWIKLINTAAVSTEKFVRLVVLISLLLIISQHLF